MDDLFAQLKPDIEAVAGPLFEASESFVRKRGGFLPHGAVLDAGCAVRVIMASPDGGETASSPDVLPLLHDGLRGEARQHDLAAVAVCEDVTITLTGQKQTKAIKVLVEHCRGLTVALYMPWRRRLLGGPVFDQVMAHSAKPEVRPWEHARLM